MAQWRGWCQRDHMPSQAEARAARNRLAEAAAHAGHMLKQATAYLGEPTDAAPAALLAALAAFQGTFDRSHAFVTQHLGG